MGHQRNENGSEKSNLTPEESQTGSLSEEHTEILFPAQQPKMWALGEGLFNKLCVFKLGCTEVSQLPEADLPEIAFVGRSNVGKSSLINALTGRQSLARTSHTPGRTQELNFFQLGEELFLVDLPGYGYAKAPKTKVLSWQNLIKDYLRGRPQLKRVFVLIDARHGIKPLDREIFTLLDKAAVSYQIVLTKLDKLPKEERQKRITETAKSLEKYTAAHPIVCPTSSHKKEGLSLVQAEISAFTAPPTGT